VYALNSAAAPEPKTLPANDSALLRALKAPKPAKVQAAVAAAASSDAKRKQAPDTAASGSAEKKSRVAPPAPKKSQ
jgi:hypothetical protein